MGLLTTGVVIWSLAHLFPSVLRQSRDRLVNRLGEQLYRGLFSLLIIGSLILVVVGWKSAPLVALYAPPVASGPLTTVLVLVGLVLFFASRVPGNIRRFIRHPQMAGTLCWAVAHLLSNGEFRSVILFGGFAIWAAVEMLTINRRDGKWQRPPPAALKNDLATVVIGSVVFALAFYLHETLFGVSVLPI